MMAVLLYLYENGPSNLTSVYSSTSKNFNMPKKLDTLIDLGLLTSSAVSVHETYVDLTKRGRYIAEHLALIESALENQS